MMHQPVTMPHQLQVINHSYPTHPPMAYYTRTVPGSTVISSPRRPIPSMYNHNPVQQRMAHSSLPKQAYADPHGMVVTYTCDSVKNQQPNLRYHVFISKETTAELADYILPESWGNDNGLLYKYIDYIWRCQMFDGQIKRFLYLNSPYLVFHSGLQRRSDGAFVYLLLIPNDAETNKKVDQKWRVALGIQNGRQSRNMSFVTADELIKHYWPRTVPSMEIPQRTLFYRSATDLVFRSDYQFTIDWEERLRTCKSRIYKVISNVKNDGKKGGNNAEIDESIYPTEQLQASLEAETLKSIELVRANPRFAVPQAFIESKANGYRLELVIPLTLHFGSNRVYYFALALRPNHEQKTYEGMSILTRTMAYANARLVGRIDSSWLTPNFAVSNDGVCTHCACTCHRYCNQGKNAFHIHNHNDHKRKYQNDIPTNPNPPRNALNRARNSEINLSSKQHQSTTNNNKNNKSLPQNAIRISAEYGKHIQQQQNMPINGNFPIYLNANTFNQMNVMPPHRHHMQQSTALYQPGATAANTMHMYQPSAATTATYIASPSPAHRPFVSGDYTMSMLNPHLNSIPNAVSFLNSSTCGIPTIAPVGSSIANMPVASMSNSLVFSSGPNYQQNSLSNSLINNNNHNVNVNVTKVSLNNNRPKIVDNKDGKKGTLQVKIPDIPQPNGGNKNVLSDPPQTPQLPTPGQHIYFTDDMLADSSPRTQEVFKDILSDENARHRGNGNNMTRSQSFNPYSMATAVMQKSIAQNKMNQNLNRIKSENNMNSNSQPPQTNQRSSAVVVPTTINMNQLQQQFIQNNNLSQAQKAQTP